MPPRPFRRAEALQLLKEALPDIAEDLRWETESLLAVALSARGSLSEARKHLEAALQNAPPTMRPQPQEWLDQLTAEGR